VSSDSQSTGWCHEDSTTHTRTLQPTNHYSDLDQNHTISYLRWHSSLVIWLKTVWPPGDLSSGHAVATLWESKKASPIHTRNKWWGTSLSRAPTMTWPHEANDQRNHHGFGCLLLLKNEVKAFVQKQNCDYFRSLKIVIYFAHTTYKHSMKQGNWD